MPIILLYGLFVVAEIAVLALMKSTGNFWGLFPAALWMLVDLTVAIAGMIVSLGADYHALVLPRLLAFHSCAFVAALIWMGVDAARDVHPLAPVFFWGFVGIACGRVLQMMIQRVATNPTPWVLAVQTVAIAAATALFISALLLPIPPDAAHAQRMASPVLADPMPTAALAAQAVRE